jgi:hypothetical protein
MNDDFEKKLLAMTAAVRRDDPTLAWKADILARARQEAGGTRLLPPRVLMAAWAVAWAAIVLLTIATPRNGMGVRTPELAKSEATQPEGKVSSPEGLTAGSSMLIAFDRQGSPLQ